MSADNTALRYLDFLTSMASFRSGDGNAIFTIWPEFIQSAPGFSDESAEPMRLFVRANETAMEIAEGLVHAPGGADWAWTVDHLRVLSELFKMEKLGQPWATITSTLDSGLLTAIRTVGTFFNSCGAMPSASVDELDDIQSLLFELRDELIAADIDRVTQRRLLDIVS